MLSNLSLGKAGELRVASELLIRGYEVFQTVVDSGVDLILANGKRIQVKSARRSKAYANYTKYTFSFKAWHNKQGNYTPHELTGIDFVILWAVDDNEFFVIPATKIRGKYSVILTCHGKRQWSLYLPYRAQWNLLEES